MVPLLLAIVQDEITHDPGVEVRYRRRFQTIRALFHPKDFRALLHVPYRPVRRPGGTLLCDAVWVVVRPQENISKFHT